MKMMSLVIVLAVLFSPTLLTAQETGRIAGSMRDAESGEALPGANVSIQGTTMGAATDANGEYVIQNVSPGAYTVVAQMVGFKTVMQKNIAVKVKSTVQVNFKLDRTTVNLGEMVVPTAQELTSENDRLALRGKVIDAETGKGIGGARVILVGSNRGTETNERGEFDLEQVRGVFDIRVKKDGYETWLDTEVPIDESGKRITVALKKEQPVETRVFAIAYKEPAEIRRLIGPLLYDDGSASHTIADNPVLRTITVRAQTDVLMKIAELIAQYDVPPSQIRVDVQLVLADGGESSRQSIPEELESIKKKLTNLFKYKEYRLAGSGSALVFEDEICELTIGGTSYRVRINKVEYLRNAGIVKLSGFQLEGRDAYLSTTINVSDGDTVIIGKASTANPNEALITIVKAEVVRY